MKQKKATKKFLKNAAKPKHGKEQAAPKKSFGKKKPKQQHDEPMESGNEESFINLKKPTSGKQSKNSIKRLVI